MESIKSNSEILSDARSWVARIDQVLRNDDSQKINFLSPFLDPWTLSVTIGVLIEYNFRWRSVAPNPSSRLQCLQATHQNNLLDWQQPDLAIISVRPDNLFSPPARSDMLEILASHLPKEASFGDVIKIDNGWAVCIARGGELHQVIPGFSLSPLSEADTGSLPPSTQSGPRHVSVSSPRIDAVASKTLKPSREQVKKLISSGGVLLNYKTTSKPGVELAPGDIVAVRGGGRFRVDDFGDVTKSGRYIVNVEILNGP